jgi:two-component system NtrC family sensor kinase
MMIDVIGAARLDRSLLWLAGTDESAETMNIRTRVILLIGGLFAALGAAQLLVQHYIILPSFIDLEHEEARTDMDRVDHALERELALLESMTVDWGNWDATYKYMRDRDPLYITANMTLSGMRDLRASAVALVDLSGKFVWSTAVVSGTTDPIELDFIKRGALPADRFWQNMLRSGEPVKGLLATNRGPMLIACTPILDGFGKGPHRGMILVGRLLTEAEIRRLDEQAQVRLALSAVRLPGAAPPDFLPDKGVGTELVLQRKEATEVYRVLNDVAGEPLLTLRIDAPRSTSARGKQSIAYAALFLFGAGVIAVVLLVMLLNRSVLGPLMQMTRHAVAIGRSDDLTARLQLQRRDELGELAREFDQMVEKLALARRVLVDYSFNAGVAENANGVLHNLGNAMTPLAVNSAELQQTLRAAPLADLDLALAELAEHSTDAERTARLQEFLQLTCHDVAASLRCAREEFDHIALQIVGIQRVLEDQVRHSGTDRVIETVRLNELVRQSAGLIAPALRQRLTLELDRSLEELGPVRIARTTLQQVFQNLILNAAEAVRDGGRERGSLRVTVRVLKGEAGETLQCCFMDDGVGIPSGDLTRVFAKGFTTKPAESNSGIGLHWCANCLNALGGSVHAESPGPGCGASFYVTLPLQRAAATQLAQVA